MKNLSYQILRLNANTWHKAIESTYVYEKDEFGFVHYKYSKRIPHFEEIQNVNASINDYTKEYEGDFYEDLNRIQQEHGYNIERYVSKEPTIYEILEVIFDFGGMHYIEPTVCSYDIIKLGDEYYFCESSGWVKITKLEPLNGEKLNENIIL